MNKERLSWVILLAITAKRALSQGVESRKKSNRLQLYGQQNIYLKTSGKGCRCNDAGIVNNNKLTWGVASLF